MDFLYLDGTILPATQATISPFDRGFLYGDGLFETLRIYNGRGHLLGRHLRRLVDGLDYLGIPHPGEQGLADAVHRTIAANKALDAVLRLTVTRGVGGAVTEIDEPSHPTILITLKPLLQSDGDSRINRVGNDSGQGEREEKDEKDGRDKRDEGINNDERGDERDSDGRGDQRNNTARGDERDNDGRGSEKNNTARGDERDNDGRGSEKNNAARGDVRDGDGSDKKEPGERLITLEIRHVEPAIGRRLKMLNYLPAIHSARALAAAGVREGILLTRDGIVAEGTVSNLFCVVDGVLCTPSLDLGILPGITRERVIELARAAEIKVREEKFDLEFFADADECFYTNSVREITPVIQLDEKMISDGKQGMITSRLSSAYRSEIT